MTETAEDAKKAQALDKKLARELRPAAVCDLATNYDSTLAALDALACGLEKRTVDYINWYLGRKNGPKNWSLSLRWLTLGLFLAGTLVPIVSGDTWVKSKLPEIDHWGYLFFGFAGVFILLERYMGFATTWMRYMKAEMALQRAHDKFRLAWAVWRLHVGKDGPTPEQVTAAVALLTGFREEVGEVVDTEFQTWIVEFQEQLAALQAAVEKGKTENRPGNLVVKFQSAKPIAGVVSIYLNGQVARQTDGGAAVLTGLVPGPYALRVTANDGALQGSATVKVEAGQTAETTVELKDVAPAATPPSDKAEKERADKEKADKEKAEKEKAEKAPGSN